MILRTEQQIQQLATLLLNTLTQNAELLDNPTKAAVKAGLQQAHKCICEGHITYKDIDKNLSAHSYPVQSRAIAVMAVDWLQGEEMDWKQFLDNLLKLPAK